MKSLPTHSLQEMHLEQWTVVDGIRFPQRSINIHDGVKRAEINVESEKLNSGMNPADLALKPANSAPVMGREPLARIESFGAVR